MPARVSRRAALAAGLSASVALVGRAAPIPKADDKSWVGKTVLPKASGLRGTRPDDTIEGAEQRWPLNAASWEVKVEKGTRVELVEDGVACWVEKTELVLLSDAIGYFDKAIQADELAAYNYNFRGWARYLLGKPADAVKDFDTFLELIPAEATGHRVVGFSNRGLVLAELGKFDAAIKDLDEATRLGHLPAQINRGWAYELKGEYKKALADYEAVAEALPYGALAQNNVAWLLATCPDAALRDGKRAIELGRLVCNRTGDREGMYLDTLAAAYAESGDFSAAVKVQELALADSGYVRKYGTEAQQRLQLYKNKKPFRTAAPKP